MNPSSRLRTVSVVIVGLLFGLLATSCDNWQSITFDNQTLSLIKVDIRSVPLDYVGAPRSFTYDAQVVPIEPRESKKFLTSIPIGRSGGVMKRYSIVAVAETNETVLYKVFTWDELHDMNWTVVITAQK